MYANLKLQYMKHTIEIYKTMIFRTIACYYEYCRPGRKKGREGVGWEATLNQGESPTFPDTYCVCCREHLH